MYACFNVSTFFLSMWAWDLVHILLHDHSACCHILAFAYYVFFAPTLLNHRCLPFIGNCRIRWRFLICLKEKPVREGYYSAGSLIFVQADGFAITSLFHLCSVIFSVGILYEVNKLSDVMHQKAEVKKKAFWFLFWQNWYFLSQQSVNKTTGELEKKMSQWTRFSISCML